MKQKENVADWTSATYQRNAAGASILKNCSTELDRLLLCDAKGDAC
jgi:hypothetical protein